MRSQMSNSEKAYCANNLCALVIEKMTASSSVDRLKAIADFMSSGTYEKLMDFDTKLWTEGPDYIIELYKEETNS